MGPDPASVSLWTLDAHAFFPSWRLSQQALLLGQGLLNGVPMVPL